MEKEILEDIEMLGKMCNYITETGEPPKAVAAPKWIAVCPSMLKAKTDQLRWNRFIEGLKKDEIRIGAVMPLEKGGQPQHHDISVAIIETGDGKFAVGIVSGNGNTLLVNYDLTDPAIAEKGARSNAELLGIPFAGQFKSEAAPEKHDREEDPSRDEVYIRGIGWLIVS